MISSMELQSPRITPILPQWDLGIVREALSKSAYEPLKVASLKHLTFKTVFLLVMTSAGRRSELQALVFYSKYIQFNAMGQVSRYILASSSCIIIRNLIKLTTPGILQSLLASQKLVLLSAQ